MNLNKMIKGMKTSVGTNLLVTPKIEAFLRDCPDGVVWDDEAYDLFRKITAAGFGANQQRGGRFGASSRGTCHRRQLFTYLGMPEGRVIDVDIANLFNDGKWRHIRWQMMGIQSGALTHVEYPLSMPKYRLTSSADGLNSVDGFLFELKGDRHMARMLDDDNPVFQKHNLQIHTMLLMTGWELASYVMEDKSSQQFREKVVRRDPLIIHEVRKELEELNEHVEHRTLPEVLPACRAKEGPYRQCPFSSRCLERDAQGNYWPSKGGDWDS